MLNKKKGYVVGFGKPPVGTRFKPGRSGNPKGRQKSRPTLEHLFAKEFEKTLLVSTDEGPKRVKKSDLLVQQFTTLALKGSPKLLFASLEML